MLLAVLQDVRKSLADGAPYAVLGVAGQPYQRRTKPCFARRSKDSGRDLAQPRVGGVGELEHLPHGVVAVPREQDRQDDVKLRPAPTPHFAGHGTEPGVFADQSLQDRAGAALVWLQRPVSIEGPLIVE